MFPPLFLDIHKETLQNKKLRSVIYESNIMRIVIMSLKKDQEIGDELHDNEDQFIKVEKGIGMLILENTQQEVKKGQSVIIPKGNQHNFRNIGETPLKFYSIYAKVFNPYVE